MSPLYRWTVEADANDDTDATIVAEVLAGAVIDERNNPDEAVDVTFAPVEAPAPLAKLREITARNVEAGGAIVEQPLELDPRFEPDRSLLEDGPPPLREVLAADRADLELGDPGAVDRSAVVELDLTDEQRARFDAAVLDLAAAYGVTVAEARERLRGYGSLGRPSLAQLDEHLGELEAAEAAGAEVGFCCNHKCRRFEYRVVVDGDVELATCSGCEWRLVHESGLTWADAAAAGYRRATERGS